MTKKDCFAYVNDRKCRALIKIDCEGCNFYKTKEQQLNETMNKKKAEDKRINYNKLDEIDINCINMAWFSKRQIEVIKLRLGLDDGIKRNVKNVGEVLGLTKQYVHTVERKILEKINLHYYD